MAVGECPTAVGYGRRRVSYGRSRVSYVRSKQRSRGVSHRPYPGSSAFDSGRC